MAAKQLQVDVCFIGGGPATLGLFCNALKSNRMHELLNGEGVAILEQSGGFGGGCLQNYGINANTSANSFMKPFFIKQNSGFKASSPVRKQAPKQKAESEEDESEGEVAEREESSDEEGDSSQKTTLPAFKDLYPNSDLLKLMRVYGSDVPPLSMVGMVLNYTGNHLLHYIHTVFKKQIFYAHTTVTGVNLLTTGEVIVHATQKMHTVEKKQNASGTIFSTKEQLLTIRCKSVVMSQGAKASFPQNFHQKFDMPKEKVIVADSFLKREPFKAKVNQLRDLQNSRPDKKLKIVIVGGSHSGFSSAWMLMNGVATYRTNNVHAKKELTEFPHAPFRKIENCQRCCNCKDQKAECFCLCSCYGYFSCKDWDIDPEVDLPKIEEGTIQIVHRGPVKVFYSSVQTAINDGYTEFKQQYYKNKNGFLYSFSGLRGDARRLYYNIRTGKENRVKMVKCETDDQQKAVMADADLVIWACGYQTSSIPIKGTDGKLLTPQCLVPYTQNNCDNKCRMLLKEGGTLVKVFGTGIGYPVKTNDGMTTIDPSKPHPRADSFYLYLNFVANTILKQILPKSQITNKLHVSKRDVDKKLVAKQKLEEKKKQEEEKKAKIAKASHYSNFIRKKTVKQVEEGKKQPDQEAKKNDLQKVVEKQKELVPATLQSKHGETKPEDVDLSNLEAEIKQIISEEKEAERQEEEAKQQKVPVKEEMKVERISIKPVKLETTPVPSKSAEDKRLPLKQSEVTTSETNDTTIKNLKQADKKEQVESDQSLPLSANENKASEIPAKIIKVDLKSSPSKNQQFIKKATLKPENNKSQQSMTLQQAMLSQSQKQKQEATLAQTNTNRYERVKSREDSRGAGSRNMYNTLQKSNANLKGDESVKNDYYDLGQPKKQVTEFRTPERKKNSLASSVLQQKNGSQSKGSNGLFMSPQVGSVFKKQEPIKSGQKPKAFCLNNGYNQLGAATEKRLPSQQSNQRGISEQHKVGQLPNAQFSPGLANKFGSKKNQQPMFSLGIEPKATPDQTKVVPVKLFQIPPITESKPLLLRSQHQRLTAGQVIAMHKTPSKKKSAMAMRKN